MVDVVLSKHEDGVAVVTLNRPEARNAISRAVHHALDDAFAAADADPSVGAIVLTGADPVFSAGIDVKELNNDPAIARQVGPRYRPVFETRKPIIGAINGPAYTGGLELALACDWLVASERATFADTHARLGLTPGWGLTVQLSEAVGTRRARQLVATCEPIDALTALRWGLVNEVIGHERMMDRALELGRGVVANDSVAVTTVLATLAAQRSVADAALWSIEARGWIDPWAERPGAHGSRGTPEVR